MPDDQATRGNDFDLVRPYVASLGEPEAPDELSGQPAIEGRIVSAGQFAATDTSLELFGGRRSDGPRHRRTGMPLRPVVAVVAGVAVVVAVIGIHAIWSHPAGSAPLSFNEAPAQLPAIPTNSPMPSPSASPTATHGPQQAPTVHRTQHSTATPTATTANTPALVAPPPSTTPPPASAHPGALVGVSGLCADDFGRFTFNGNPIVAAHCDGTSSQTWTMRSDGTLHVVDKCARESSTAKGSRVELWDCDGSAAEVWHANGHALVNGASGLCLDAPRSSRSQTAALEIATCDGSANESWTLP